MPAVSVEIPSDQISSVVRKEIEDMNLVPKNDLKGITWTIDEFRKKCCGGKSANWVRTFIFDRFPETDYINGGWCLAPHKTDGIKATIINAYDAKQWMANHWREIDWKGKLA